MTDPKIIQRLTGAAELALRAHVDLWMSSAMACDEAGIERERRLAHEALDRIFNAKFMVIKNMNEDMLGERPPQEEAPAEAGAPH